ncbi:MAG: hypothetical protein HY900_26135 [Deltaproteobacteria bacterium]|nr:hypothetical protein [Deltaproteobacteria bacterium]
MSSPSSSSTWSETLKPSCPVCGAQLGDSPSCYRCKADLSELFRLREAARALLALSRIEYRAGAYGRALALARESLSVHRTEAATHQEILALFRTGNREEAFSLWCGLRRDAWPVPGSGP